MHTSRTKVTFVGGLASFTIWRRHPVEPGRGRRAARRSGEVRVTIFGSPPLPVLRHPSGLCGKIILSLDTFHLSFGCKEPTMCPRRPPGRRHRPRGLLLDVFVMRAVVASLRISVNDLQRDAGQMTLFLANVLVWRAPGREECRPCDISSSEWLRRTKAGLNLNSRTNDGS